MKGITRIGFVLMLLVVLVMTVACTSQFERGQLAALENPDAVVLAVYDHSDHFVLILPDGGIVLAYYRNGGAASINNGRPFNYSRAYPQPIAKYPPIPPCP